MDIRVNLPKPNNIVGKEIKHFLRQMELAVHHLQKSVAEIEANGESLDDYYIIYKFPLIELYDREANDKGEVLVHVDEELDQMQEIWLEINKI
jgi:hypothetical protein